ncbi:MAG TPA: ABC transporter ATP-binding protein [Candidatus Saccharimonadales bacterium]
MKDYAIHVDHLSKTFKLPHERQTSVKSALIHRFRGGRRSFEQQHVLKDISFTVKKGEFFGIVGRNGSGKSTLLKILASIYMPTEGSVKINGSLTPFIELGVGFNPELTGRENVFLNGALLGFSRKEMYAMYEDIVAFAEIEKFMDQKLKNYSSGMQVRLAFAIAIKAQTDILLLDEVLAVGDADFQRKCYDYFMSLKKKKQTVILVTHDMGAVRQYCDRAVMIEKGQIAKSGTAEEVAQEYQKLFIDASSDEVEVESDVWGEGGMVVDNTSVKVTDDAIEVITSYTASKNLPPPVYGFVLYNQAGVNVLEANTIKEKLKTISVKQGDSLKLSWKIPNMLPDGTFTLSVACCDQSTTHFYQWVNNAATFKVRKYTKTAGIVDPEIKVNIAKV